jgi:hypothetical protein
MEGLGRGSWWMAAIGQSLADLATGWQLPAFENVNLPLGIECVGQRIGYRVIPTNPVAVGHGESGICCGLK